MFQMCVVLLDELDCIIDYQRISASSIYPLLVIPKPNLNLELLQYEIVSSATQMLVYLLISVTFGLTSPYLGVVMVLSMWYRLEVFVLVYMSSEAGFGPQYRSSSHLGRASVLELPGISIFERSD